MSRLRILGVILSIAGLGVEGCGHSTPQPPTPPPAQTTHILVKWLDNGNPAAIPCSASASSTVSCISSIVVTNLTTNESTSVQPTNLSVVINGSATDNVQVKAVGYNGQSVELDASVTVAPQ